MPPSRLFLPKRRSIQSPSLLPDNSSPNGTSTSIVPRTLPDTSQAVYPDYLNETASPGWDAALAVVSILKDIPAVPLALVNPLTQVLDVVSGISDAVKKMRDANDECKHLMFRVLKLLRSLVNGLKGRNIADSTPTADSLLNLRRDLLEIHADATRWASLKPWKLYLQGDKIMAAISKHGDHLTDCLHAFQIVALMTASNPAARVETAVFPGQSTSARPLAASENTPGPIVAAGFRDFLDGPAGQAIFEQIGAALQGRLEGMGSRMTAARPGSQPPDITILRSGRNRHVSYLTRQISELTTEVGVILPDIPVATDIEAQFVGWRGTHRPQTGNPTRQFGETVSATLQLLKELHGTPEIELDSAILSKKMNELGSNLGDLGLWDEAIKVWTTLVKLLRAGGNPSDVAFSLNNLSTCLWDIRRNEEALKACHEAVGIYRLLAADRSDSLGPALAASLNNLSVELSEVDRHDEGLKAIKEASDIYRQVAEEWPDIFHPYLALSLNNLSRRLSDLGRDQEALEAIEEAVAIYRRLEVDQPNRFHRDLARPLDNLSLCLSIFARHKEALKASEEAVCIYRALAEDRPKVFDRDIAGSLSHLSSHLVELGRDQEALEASEEAVSIYRRLVEDRPNQFHPDLAGSLRFFSLCLSKSGRHQEACEASEEAVSLYRLLAPDCLNAFRPGLAHTLTNRSLHLWEFGRYGEALKSNEEALNIYRDLAAERPDRFHPDLALSLDNHSVCLSKFGRYPEALEAIERAVSIYRRLEVDRPNQFRPDFAYSLDNLSNHLSRVSRYKEALKASEEAVCIYRSLDAERPEVFHPYLAHSLDNLSLRLSDSGRHEEALRSNEEALGIYRSLAEERPDAHCPDLAR